MKLSHSGPNSPSWRGGKNKCVDCGKLLSDWTSKRCKKCWSLFHRGANCENWKGGISKILKCCPDCGKQLKWYLSKYCKKCFATHRTKYQAKKEEHYRWKGGRPKCLDCGKEIEWKAKRCSSCAKIGEHNVAWKGGVSLNQYPIIFNKILKQKIKERDEYKCVICNKIFKKSLAVHHIDYNKQNNNPKNLISLCCSCHSKTNFNRKSWILFFSKIKI